MNNMDDKVFTRYEDISDAINSLVNEMTDDLTDEENYAVRLVLQEQYRFWSRVEKHGGEA